MKETYEMTLEEYEAYIVRDLTEREGKHAADEWLQKNLIYHMTIKKIMVEKNMKTMNDYWWWERWNRREFEKRLHAEEKALLGDAYYNRELYGYRFHATNYRDGTHESAHIEFPAELPPDDILDRIVMGCGLYGFTVYKYPEKHEAWGSGYID